MRKYFKQIFLVIILLVVGLLLYFSFFNKSDKVSYITEKVTRGDIVKTVNATGEVGAVQLVSVGAQVSGQIEKLYVQLGQQVKKGDMIAEIDSTTQVNELNTNKARLETYNAQLVSAKIAQQIAQTKYNRELKLIMAKASSKANLEDAKNTLAAAKAKVSELQSTIKQTQISVNTSEVNLGYTRITSPLDGTVVSIPVEEGQTVNANQTTPTIVQVADLSEMEIKMLISEGDVTKVKPGMEVTYTILSEPDEVFSTTLRSVDPGLTDLTEGSYTGSTSANSAVYYYGKLIVPNEEGKLHIGMTTQNVINIDARKNVLVLPSIVIKQYRNKKFVNVLVNNQIQRREIKTGLTDTMNTEIIEGIEEGETIVASQMTHSEINQGASSSMRRSPRF